MAKRAKEKVSTKQLNRDIILLKDTLNYLDGISRLNRSSNSFITNQDLLASASFQLLQVSRNLNRVSKRVLKMLPSIDMDMLNSWSNNLISNYFKVNHDMLIAYLKDISRDAIKNEINSAYRTTLNTRLKIIQGYKKSVA